jgi:sugar lactone lactonase YvrE
MLNQQEPTVFIDNLIFPESLRWRSDKLYFSDIHAYEVVAVDLDGTRKTIIRVPGNPGGLGFLPDGRLLVASMTERKLLRLDNGMVDLVADIIPWAAAQINDILVDKTGRCYIGQFGADIWSGKTYLPADLLMVSPSGQVTQVASDIHFGNGMALTQDGKTLIIAETRIFRLTAFDVNRDGTLRNRRVWADLGSLPPDGICLDGEGNIWVAAPRGPDGGGFFRIKEGGKIDTMFQSKGYGGFSCMLGGPDRKTLFMGESKVSRPPPTTRDNGRIKMVRVSVAGSGLP